MHNWILVEVIFRLLEKYSSGWRGAPAKGVGRSRGARVQIPPSPFSTKQAKNLERLRFLFFRFLLVEEYIISLLCFLKATQYLVVDNGKLWWYYVIPPRCGGEKCFKKIILKYFKKSVDTENCTWYYKRVAAHKSNNTETKRTLTNKHQCNPENSLRISEKRRLIKNLSVKYSQSKTER